MADTASIGLEKQASNRLLAANWGVSHQKIMETHDIFISHSSATKELARHIYYNAISNGIQPWYDEAFLKMGDDLDPTIAEGIQNSKSFLLIHSQTAMEKRWVPMEMELAKEKHIKDQRFRLLVVKLDDEPLPNDGFWDNFLYEEWSNHHVKGDVVDLLTNQEIFHGIFRIRQRPDHPGRNQKQGIHRHPALLLRRG